MGVFHVFSKVSSVSKEFFRYASYVNAGPAQIKVLCHGYLCTITGSKTASPDTAGAGANDEKIKIKLAHIICLTAEKEAIS